MSKIIHTTNIWTFIFAFGFITILIFSVLSIDKKSRIDSHLQNATHTFSTQYTTVYNSYKNMSKTAHSIIFDSPLINSILEESLSKNPKIVNEARVKLYNLLKNKYKKLSKLGFKQIHFHTKDNKSFLRMHQVEKYGDDLSDIRYSVTYVNQHQKYIHGLEAGRIVHGFRFVYPMYNETKYLGSVEFSISSEAFIDAIEKSFDTDIHFIVDKKLIYSKLFENYKNTYKHSDESADYLKLIEKTPHKNIYHIPKKIIRDKIGDKIDKNIKNDKAFSTYFSHNDDFNIVTFLPLKNIQENKIVAYLVSYTKNTHIKEINADFIKIVIILELLTILFLYFIYLLNQNKQKLLKDQKIILENSKLDSMREMIGNIAHHWRQPLSVISTTASSVKVQKELNILKEEYLHKSLDNIVQTTKDLSKTIDDFREFITSQNEKSTFTMDSVIKKLSTITGSSIQNNYITFIKDIHYDKEITSFENTLVESIIKILNNSIDALQNIEEQDDRYIFLKAKKEKNKLFVSIQDTGGGIADKHINHIFEPYFTTKHQTPGTGLGLYTVRTNIINILHGEIEVKNSTFEYNSKTYTGAMFTITLKI